MFLPSVNVHFCEQLVLRMCYACSSYKCYKSFHYMYTTIISYLTCAIGVVCLLQVEVCGSWVYRRLQKEDYLPSLLMQQ